VSKFQATFSGIPTFGIPEDYFEGNGEKMIANLTMPPTKCLMGSNKGGKRKVVKIGTLLSFHLVNISGNMS